MSHEYCTFQDSDGRRSRSDASGESTAATATKMVALIGTAAFTESWGEILCPYVQRCGVPG